MGDIISTENMAHYAAIPVDLRAIGKKMTEELSLAEEEIKKSSEFWTGKDHREFLTNGWNANVIALNNSMDFFYNTLPVSIEDIRTAFLQIMKQTTAVTAQLNKTTVPKTVKKITAKDEDSKLHYDSKKVQNMREKVVSKFDNVEKYAKQVEEKLVDMGKNTQMGTAIESFMPGLKQEVKELHTAINNVKYNLKKNIDETDKARKAAESAAEKIGKKAKAKSDAKSIKKDTKKGFTFKDKS